MKRGSGLLIIGDSTQLILKLERSVCSSDTIKGIEIDVLVQTGG